MTQSTRPPQPPSQPGTRPTQPSATRPPTLPPASPDPATATQPARGRLSIERLWQRVWTTLRGQFIALAALALGLSLLQAAVTSTQLRQANQNLVTIGRDSTPSVDAAQAMAQYIEDIDAKAADYIGTAGLTDLRPCALPGPDQSSVKLTVHDCSDRTIDAEISLFNQEMYQAVRNVTYPGEHTALDRTNAGFQEYTAQLDVMRHEYGLAALKTDPNDEHMRRAQEAYRRADDVLQTKINRQPAIGANGVARFNEPTLPDCMTGDRVVLAANWPLGSMKDTLGCFNSINRGYLDRAYTDATTQLGSSLAFIVASSLVLCAMLLFTNWRMAAVTHRVINLGLIVALLLGIGYSAVIVARFTELGGSQGIFKQLVRDSYDSVYYTAILKRVGTAANADESRWLVATQFGDQAGTDHWLKSWQANTAEVQMYMDRAIGNETYPEEREPLSVIQRDWNAYYALDARIRQTAGRSGVVAAEGISTGASNQAFGVFVATVDRLSAANRTYFDRIYQDTQAKLNREMLASMILFPLAGLAAAWGIYVRLKDF